MEEILLTPSSLLDFLLKIEELKDLNVGMEQTDSSIIVSIGDSTYQIDTSDATEIAVDEESIEVVEDTNQETLDEIMEEEDVEEVDTVESGILKEVAKSLLLGGMIRLSTKLLK